MPPNKLLLYGQTLIEKNRSWFLAPLSVIYGALVSLRNLLYDRSLLKITKVKPVVVSIGNIIAGGTGKTPFVHLLTSAFPKRKVAILSRGYGHIPDEAMLLAKKLPKIRVCVGKNRAELARQIDDVDLILLDDGFQHRKLFRDIDVVLTRETLPRFLPWGFLRDHPKRLEAADFVFRSEIDYHLKVKAIRNKQGRKIPSIKGCKSVTSWSAKTVSLTSSAPKSITVFLNLQGAAIPEKIPTFHPLIEGIFRPCLFRIAFTFKW